MERFACSRFGLLELLLHIFLASRFSEVRNIVGVFEFFHGMIEKGPRKRKGIDLGDKRSKPKLGSMPIVHDFTHRDSFQKPWLESALEDQLHQPSQ